MGLQSGWVGGLYFILFYFVRMNNKTINFAYLGGCSILSQRIGPPGSV